MTETIALQGMEDMSLARDSRADRGERGSAERVSSDWREGDRRLPHLPPEGPVICILADVNAHSRKESSLIASHTKIEGVSA